MVLENINYMVKHGRLSASFVFAIASQNVSQRTKWPIFLTPPFITKVSTFHLRNWQLGFLCKRNWSWVVFGLRDLIVSRRKREREKKSNFVLKESFEATHLIYCF